MDYSSRIINDRIVDDKIEYYRVLGNGREIITNRNGDVFIEVSKAVFDAPLPPDMTATIEYYYKGLGKVYSLRDVFLRFAIARDDEMVCFRSGIMDVTFIIDDKGSVKRDEDGYKMYSYNGRPKHPSNGEFEMLITSLANEDYSNISVDNPYKPKEDIG